MGDLLGVCERCLQYPDPRCVKGCPAHNDISGFIHEAKLGDFEIARAIVALNSCLPGACSRVCDWSNRREGACSWTLLSGESGEIGKIERFIADYFPDHPVDEEERNNLKVAIIGSGPGWLGAAYGLCKDGMAVAIFERDAEPGGIMRRGIPSSVLPRESLFTQVDETRKVGVNFRFDSPVNTESLDGLLEEYDAIIYASGAD